MSGFYCFVKDIHAGIAICLRYSRRTTRVGSDCRLLASSSPDEKVIADTLVMILKRKGFAAIPAYGGVSALQIAAVTPPNLLLTDVVMPDMNGVDLAIEICRQVPDCDVLLLSGQAATTDLLARYPEIADSFTVLPKPIHPRELMVKLAHLLPTNIPESPAV